MNANILQSGLNLANYLQAAFPSEVVKGAGDGSEYDRGQQQASQPPALIRSLIDSGRLYFRVSHEDVINNLLYLFVPIGKTRQFVPDLYIPVVSISTFLLLRSTYMVLNSNPQPYLGDVLGRTLTRVCLMYIIEMIVLSGLLYVTDPTISHTEGLRQSSVSTDGSCRSRATSPHNSNEDRRSAYLGGDRHYGTYRSQTANTVIPAPLYNQVEYSNRNVAPMWQNNTLQSQYGNYATDAGIPMGPMDNRFENYEGQFNLNTGGLGATKDGRFNEGLQHSKYMGDNMVLPLAGKHSINVPEKLFIMGYKYLLLNFYIIGITLMPLKWLTISAGAYFAAISVMFSLRAVGSLKGEGAQVPNPLMYIFPALQPLFCYILLPNM